jgi:hypothetical protein
MVRGGAALLAALLAYVGVTFSFAQAVAARDSATAYRLAPYAGRLTARYAASATESVSATAEDRKRSDDLARRALRQDATAVAAIATLGLNAEVRGDVAGARRAFRYARSLSRRDLRTQLWSIEDAVRRNDIPGALREYDITLRAIPKLSEILYPILASASTDPAIRPELIKVLGRGAVWGGSFIAYMGRSIPDPASTASLFIALKRAGVSVEPAAWTGAINALVESKRFDDAWSLYAMVRPRADRLRARDLRGAGALAAPSLLDWVVLEDNGVAASIQNGIFDFAAPASVGGPVLRQVQLLRPGSYRLTGHSIGVETQDDARPYWALTCRKGRELGRVPLPNSASRNGEFSGLFVVTADCPVQELALVVPPSDAVSGVSGQIDRVALDPAR